MKRQMFAVPALLAAGFFGACDMDKKQAAALPTYSPFVNPFTDQTDIGAALPKPGSSSFNAATGAVSVTAGGQNIWAMHDDFHFVWKKVSGDNISLAADIAFAPGTEGVVAHRKTVLMIRQSLDPDAAYADACIHGNGMTALQWRDGKGAISYEVMANLDAPKRIRIEKRGSYFSASAGTTDADLQPTGGAIKIDLTGEYYVGIGISSHSVDRLETATFSNIAFGTPTSLPMPTTAPATAGAPRTNMINTLQVYQPSNRDRKVVYVATQPGNRRFEAPNWSRDNSNTLYFNNGGRMYKVPAILPTSDPTTIKITPELVDLGILTNLNNDHVLSFDGKTYAVSDQSQAERRSAVWTVPMDGKGTPTPKRITANSPSYMHGWSPDGKTLVFAAPRNPNANNGNWDIYSIASDGTGEEKRLTTTEAREDGPEFSPDGQYIYFNSTRTGSMQIWRMKPDGSGQEQFLTTDTNDWFPHISPDGTKMVFISFDKTVAPDDHPESKDVTLHYLDMKTKAMTLVAKAFGGQGTINVPSWSPNSQYFAFVTYQIVPQ